MKVSYACRLVVAATFPSLAHATFSIFAADAATGQVGGAGAACTNDSVFEYIYHSVPGKGAFHKQGFTNPEDDALITVAKLGLEVEQHPVEILDALTINQTDPFHRLKQYGIVDLQGRSAAYTGDLIGNIYRDQNYTEEDIGIGFYQDDRTGTTLDRMPFAAQGMNQNCELPGCTEWRALTFHLPITI